MKQNDLEKLFKQIAQRYAEHEGEELEQQRRVLEKDNVQYDFSALDRRAKSIRHASRPSFHHWGLVAAGLMLVILIPLFFALGNSVESPISPQSSVEEAPSESLPAQPEPKPIPLSFALPDNLTIANVEEDRGKSIYYLRDRNMDDVILTLEYIDHPPSHEDLQRININNSTAYVRYLPDYSLMTLDKDGVRYEMTCRYDVNTLMELGAKII